MSDIENIEKENVSEGVSTVEWDGMVECGMESEMIKVKVCHVETSSAESTEKLQQKIKKKVWIKGKN